MSDKLLWQVHANPGLLEANIRPLTAALTSVRLEVLASQSPWTMRKGIVLHSEGCEQQRLSPDDPIL